MSFSCLPQPTLALFHEAGLLKKPEINVELREQMRQRYDEWKAEHANDAPFQDYSSDGEYSDDYPPTPTSFDSYTAGLRRERAKIKWQDTRYA
jgi:hypothetical protein